MGINTHTKKYLSISKSQESKIEPGTQKTKNFIQRLKGGSLSGTYLIEKDNKKFVRKEVPLNENREYGFYRWYSQLKRLQRFGELFPSVFPRVLSYGIEGEKAYFDIEYIEGAINGFEFVESNPSKSEIDAFLKALIETMEKLHSHKRESCKEALKLYIYEEIERPLKFCLANPKFKDFSQYDNIFFNRIKVTPIALRLKEIYEFAEKYYNNPWECYTHGNITLENTLWVAKEKKVIFIDPYEENIADTVYNEYSQVLQSSNSYYELYNKFNAKVEGNKVTLEVEKNPGLDYFNEKFLEWINTKMSEDEMKIVYLYEISQFTRMLPFKMYISKEKMIFFYTLASYLLDKLLREEN